MLVTGGNCLVRALALLVANVAMPGPAGAQQPNLPDGPGKEALVRVCSACHGLDKATTPGRTPEDWGAEVGKMAQLGAKATDDEFNAIADYLAENFPPQSDKTNVNQASARELTSQLGFSDKESENIVQYRKDHGAFKVLDDLKKVPELDAKKVDALKDRIAF